MAVVVLSRQQTKKRCFVKVFKKNGEYIGTYRAVKDYFQYTQAINTPGATTTIILARSANSKQQIREPLTDHLGRPYQDHNGQPYFLSRKTSNSVGPGTDVMNGHQIEVYVVYGRFEPWTDHLGRRYTDHNGQPYELATGAPLGRTVFRGKIVKWKANYDSQSSVTVTVMSNGMELTRGEVIRTGAATTVTHANKPIETIVKSILDNDPGRITYDAATIQNTGVTVEEATFQLNTKLQGIESIVKQTDAGWWWYVNPADDKLYLRPRSATPHHIFYRRKHLETVEIEEDATELRNRIYVVGGKKTDGTTLFKVYQDSAAIDEFGLGTYPITDRRITKDSTAQRFASKMMSRFARPVYTSTIRVPSAVYDVESVRLGQMVGFRDFNNFINDQVLQIVNRQYHPDYVELQLGELLEDQKQVVADIADELSNEQYENIPIQPA